MPANNGSERTVPMRSTPEGGDIVIREENRAGEVVWVLNTVPGPEQYVVRSCDEGVAQALTFAKIERVQAWVVNEGHDFVLLEDFRIRLYDRGSKRRSRGNRRPSSITARPGAPP